MTRFLRLTDPGPEPSTPVGIAFDARTLPFLPPGTARIPREEPLSGSLIFGKKAPSRLSGQGGQLIPEETPTPDGSFSGFFERHGSTHAWKEYVWEDELTQPAILLPLALGGSETYSNVGQDALIGAAILSGAIFPGEGRNNWDAFWTQGEAFLACSLTIATLKTVAGRPRPRGSGGSGNGTTSFPSGHAGAAFTSATLIERNSGLLAGLPAYGLAGFTAFERVEAGRHCPSDVLADAAIGCLSAGIVDSLHRGSGPGRGISRTEPNRTIGFVDRLPGVTLDFEIPV